MLNSLWRQWFLAAYVCGNVLLMWRFSLFHCNHRWNNKDPRDPRCLYFVPDVGQCEPWRGWARVAARWRKWQTCKSFEEEWKRKWNVGHPGDGWTVRRSTRGHSGISTKFYTLGHSLRSVLVLEKWKHETKPSFAYVVYTFFCYSVDLDDCTIALWLLSELADVSTQKPLSLLNGHSGGVTCLAFSPDGGQLLSGGKDKVLSHN